jgi:hypothetical protein
MKQVLRWLVPMVPLGMVVVLMYWVFVQQGVEQQPEQEVPVQRVEETTYAQLPPEEGLPVLPVGEQIPGQTSTWPRERYARIVAVETAGEEYVVELTGESGKRVSVLIGETTLLRQGTSRKNDDGDVVSWVFEEVSKAELVQGVDVGDVVTVAYQESGSGAEGEVPEVTAAFFSILAE